MLVKLGVDISRLNRMIRKALPTIEEVFHRWCGAEVVITSTYEGDHGEGSLHYANDAIDIRNVFTKPANFIGALKSQLSQDYDIVFEGNHIHIEYDPKPKG